MYLVCEWSSVLADYLHFWQRSLWFPEKGARRKTCQPRNHFSSHQSSLLGSSKLLVEDVFLFEPVSREDSGGLEKFPMSERKVK